MDHDEAAGRTGQPPTDADLPTRATRSKTWRWVVLGAVVVVLAFLAGLYFPRSWLPGDFATHLPSSCSATLAKARDLTGRVADADPTVVGEFQSLVDDRPDCFTDEDRKLLGRSLQQRRVVAVAGAP